MIGAMRDNWRQQNPAFGIAIGFAKDNTKGAVCG